MHIHIYIFTDIKTVNWGVTVIGKSVIKNNSRQLHIRQENPEGKSENKGHRDIQKDIESRIVAHSKNEKVIMSPGSTTFQISPS